MKLKDVMIVSLLGVVGFVISMVSSLITPIFGTYAIFVHVSIGTILCAPIYFVMCHRIGKKGTIFLYYLISGVIYCIIGFVPMLPIVLLAGLFGELLIGRREHYDNDRRIAVSYCISQLIYALHGFFFILVLGVSGLVKTVPNLFTVEQAQMAKALFFNPKTMAIILAIEIVAAVLGSLLGKFLYHKFFNKSVAHQEILP